MNKNRIQNDDQFFQPKDISKREERINAQHEEFLLKIKVGLQNIKQDYKNKNWDSKEEKLFLEVFSKFSLHLTYEWAFDRYYLKNRNNKVRCFFDLKHNIFWFSYDHVQSIFRRQFKWQHYEVQFFMKSMLDKYFKLYEFMTEACISV